MIPYKTIAVLGGDLRQTHIANQLAAQGKQVHALLMEENPILSSALCPPPPLGEALRQSEVVILPLPLCADGTYLHTPFSERRVPLTEVFEALSPQARVFAGRVSEKAWKLAQAYEVKLCDYLEREDLALQNAVLTAEGALALAIEETPIALYGSTCLVTGYGRIARTIARMLYAMGAHVVVCARKYEALAEARAIGCEALLMTRLEEAAARASIVFNTVPAPVFTREVLARLKPGALVIDLASKPGGIAFDAAREMGIKTIWALSLPGKIAPISAGDIILETIDNCLSQEVKD